MLSARLVGRWLLKYISHVLKFLTKVATSSAQRLRVLMVCFRRFVTRIRSSSRRSMIDSKSPESVSESRAALTTGTGSTSSGWCSYSTSPLPFHTGQTTPVSAASSSQPVVSSPSSPSITMPPSNAEQDITDRTSLHAQVKISDGSTIRVEFTPLHASNFLRYESRPPANKSIEYKGIPGLRRKFPNESWSWPNGPTGWQPCVHPEGALYLYNESRRTFTEANTNEITYDFINECVDTLYGLCPASVNLEDNDIELVLQVSQTKALCQYYFADHTNRILFWLQKHIDATDDIFCGLQGIYDPSHVGYALEAEYWIHCERYPNHKLDRVKLLRELRELVMYARAETITSHTSLSPFATDELANILDLIGQLESNTEVDDALHSTCVIARFMHYFTKAKFFNFCGLPCARLDADKSVYEESSGPLHSLTSKLILAFDAMLFWTPQAHYIELRKVWVDECIIAPRWKDFSRNLMAEWTGITIYSTVMLAVDVSFLAVPNVNISQSQSFGIISTYLSTIFITGSLIASLLLARQTQSYGAESAVEATRLLSKMTGTFFGMRALATIHSLPYAMLLWGMIFFAMAFLYNVFKHTTLMMLASVVSGCTVVTMFILWFIWAARDSFFS